MSKNTVYKHRYNIALYIFMLLDFLYTNIGIRYLGVIEEAIPYMMWLFNLDFQPALAVRLIITTILVGTICYVKEINHRWYSTLIGIGLAANIWVMLLHFNWLIMTLKYTI